MLRMTSSLGWRLALGLLGGALVPLGFAPFDWWPLGVLGVALHYLSLVGSRPREAGWLGFVFGVGLFGVGVSWIYVSIHDYGAAPPPLAALITFGFVLLLASYQALQCYLWRRWCADRLPAWTFAASWLLVESWRGWFLTGFPWLYLGYAHVSSPLSGLAPLVGVQGLGLLVALLAAVPVQALLDWRAGAGRRAVLSALAPLLILLLVTVALHGTAWTQPAQRLPLRVALVQGNIPQELKFDPAAIQAGLDRYAALTEPVWPLDLVVWPETAIPLVYQNEPALLQSLDERAAASGTALVTGVFFRSDQGLHNSVVALGAGSGVWHKQRLVPFGEYVPLREVVSDLLALFELPLSSLAPGSDLQQPLQVQGIGVAPFICYEVVYPEFVRTHAAEAGLLLTVSNDTWFGDSIGPHQHLQIAAMRARELGRSMLRATNNGITAVIDPQGRSSAALPQFAAAVLEAEVQVYEGLTPFARWGERPLWWLSLGFVSLLALWQYRSRVTIAT